MKPLTFVLIILLLSSCAPKTQAVSTPMRTLEKGDTFIINSALYLKTFPRSVIYQMEEDGNRTNYVFYTPLLIDSVFDNYHFQLTGNGWSQETLRKFGTAYEAHYVKQDQRLTVRLRLEGDKYIFETN